MAEILRIFAGEEPSHYTNHVLVEQTEVTTYRGSGVSNRSGTVDHFSPPVMRVLSEILKAAAAWADSHDIAIVHVRLRD